MFAEELKGNTTRKRQEEARARRRQIKQQQQKKQQQSRKVEGVSSTTSASAVVNPPVATATQESSFAVPPTDQSTAKPTAVATALQQRQIRQEQQLKQKSALVIQSFYRAHRSNSKLLAEQASLLSQRLKDLDTLRSLILQKTNASYVPPPATATVLARQLLFITKSIPYKQMNATTGTHTKLRNPTDDLVRIHQVLQNVLLPGLVGKDDNLDPILTWLDGSVGRIRLMELLRLCLVSLTSKSAHGDVLPTIDSFLRAVLGISSTKSARGPIVDQCRVILPTFHSLDSTYPPPAVGKKNIQPPPFAVTGSDLDIIQILRYQLLFGGGKPIPNDAEKRREACIPASLRERNDVLFVTIDAVQTAGAGSERQRLQSRFVADILTVPLLSWKVSIASMSKLVALDSSCRPVVLAMLTSFVQEHAAALSAGKIASALPNEVPMKMCPATPVQALLANLVQIGRICPSINGSDSSKINYKDAAFFFDFIATLVDAVSLGTFSSRESAVEWISDGDHHTPIVLSPVVCDQCKLLLVDSFVRNLFNCAIDNDALGTDDVLRSKNDKDLKQEKEMAEVGTSSATSLAASEARVDRSKGFWKSSKWARKLSSGMSKMLSKEDPNASSSKTRSSVDGGQGMLIDTSSVSRKLAHGKGPHDRNVTNAILANDDAKEHATFTESGPIATQSPYSPDFLFALCRVYAIVLARWGGGGRDDITRASQWETPLNNRENEDRKAQAAATADPLMRMLLNVLCFSTSLVPTLWALTQSNPSVVADLYSVIDVNRSALPIRAMAIRPAYDASVGGRTEKGNTGQAVLLLFVSCLSHSLIITDDVEIHEMDKPLPLHHLRRCIQVLKKLLYRACCVDDKNTTYDSNYFGLALVSSSSRTMRDLYDRSSRRPLCVPKAWLIEDLLDKELKQCKTAGQYSALLATPVLRVCPFLVSFKRRLKLFERIVTLNRIEIQGINDQNPFNSNPLKPGIPVRIMRTRLLEDGLATLNNLGSNMRQRIVVHYTNEAGRQETGIDAGGLFKEFWTDLSQIAFDPNYALFRVTEGNCLYPNPSSYAAHGPDHIVLFEFLGRILGKSLFEGITVHPQFAHFFLSFMRGDYNFLHQFSDLSTMDAQLYNNLMFLKTYEGDAEELCLTFTVANDDFGGNKEIELIPNGAEIAVTNANKHRYIGLVAKHHVCDRVRVQSEAFRRGLWEVIDRSWLRIFNEPELQVLISGPSDGKIDVADMRANSRYAGGYTPIDRNINRFWSVVASLSSKQQAALLRFVTSCERPPPLGFSTLNPPFTIQRIGILRDGDKLPTASTCFNVLKLPTYSSEKVLRQRLIYAIESGAGFELT